MATMPESFTLGTMGGAGGGGGGFGGVGPTGHSSNGLSSALFAVPPIVYGPGPA